MSRSVLSQDVLGSLRPQLARYTNFEEASEAVAAVEAAEAAAEAAGLPAEDSDSDENDTRRLGSDSEDGGSPETFPIWGCWVSSWPSMLASSSGVMTWLYSYLHVIGFPLRIVAALLELHRRTCALHLILERNGG